MRLKASTIGIFLAAALCLPAVAQTRAPTCADLNWSTAVLAANPDIAEVCLAVYVKGKTYYAKSQIQLVRVSGNSLTFRPRHRDGSFGAVRSVTVPPEWRANLEGRSTRPGDLQPGQMLSVYLPEDRFALVVDDVKDVEDVDGPDSEDPQDVE